MSIDYIQCNIKSNNNNKKWHFATFNNSKAVILWFYCIHELFLLLLQGERGSPGVNGTQGFQGCPGQRGVKVSELN